VERETLVLPILKEIGLPVPEILSNTVPDPSSPDLNSMMVMEFLPGETLQACALSDVSLAAQLLSEAIQRLHSVSDPRLADLIPRRSLLEDLDQAAVGPWMESSEIQDRVRRLRRVVEGIDIPLVFSNGDYQPANFLSDGESLTGMLDFEKAAFVDPLSVLARFPVYDLRPLSRSGFVESHLVRAGFTMRDFAARVAVFCLRTLQLKAPKTGGTEQQVALRRHVLELLSQAIDNVAD
jgi:aminoglycoside phosphotransferase (APT) family kinase protein